MLQPVRLNPGQTLYGRDQLPPGVLLIKQGDMRLLGLDQRKEVFTLQRFRSGEIVGGELGRVQTIHFLGKVSETLTRR